LQHACDQSPLDKGKVEISGPESRSLPTGADGWAKFDGIKPGNYSINGTQPQHYPGSTSANAPDAHTTEVKLPLQATIQIAATKAEYTVVLDKDGAAPAAFPILGFSITKGPPNHLFDVQLSRDGAGSFTGGPGLANSWVQADGRDARMNRHVFSSWANGQKTLKLDGSGNATFAMPLEWWRDQARQKRADFTNFTYTFRVVAFKAAATPVCAFSAASSVVLHNNLVKFQVVNTGYTPLAHSIRMEFTTKEANTSAMYTMVQWMQGSFKEWSGTPPVMRFPPGHVLYGFTHTCDFTTFTIDRLRTNPRYWDGNYTPDADGRGLTVFATDAPSAGLSDGFSTGWDSVDFETRIHLNFEVPAAVTVISKEGTAPNLGKIVGALADPQPIKLDSNPWTMRVLQVRKPDGSVDVKNPENGGPDTFAGP
jgi:hypothetical protein